jgi:hypothetical protein
MRAREISVSKARIQKHMLIRYREGLPRLLRKKKPIGAQASGSRAKYAARTFLALDPAQILILQSMPVVVTLVGEWISTRTCELESISRAAKAKKIIGARWNGDVKRVLPEYPESVSPVPPNVPHDTPFLSLENAIHVT